MDNNTSQLETEIAAYAREQAKIANGYWRNGQERAYHDTMAAAKATVAEVRATGRWC